MATAKTIGRPSVVTTETVRKVVYARRRGLSVRAACRLSGISHEAYYYHVRENRQFSHILQLAEEEAVNIARMCIVQKIIEGDIKTCRWYLEHRVPEEYGRLRKS